MRYYRYGSDKKQPQMETKELETADQLGQFGELIIDENTIYEIDGECMRCREQTQNGHRTESASDSK